MRMRESLLNENLPTLRSLTHAKGLNNIHQKGIFRLCELIRFGRLICLFGQELVEPPRELNGKPQVSGLI
jgi:hypothetical protein